ncbi:MAG TPA: two-component system response regulator [Elusimicrobia bacterium]|nr:two-component system response regulator [Elusimicrobiota bacterium]
MKHKILIVDDEENILFVVKAALAGKYDVFTAPEGASALEIIRREKPAFVFLDIKMPGLSGLEVLGLIKDTGAAPVVWMLTGDEDLEMAMKTLETGASGYLTKPFDIERLRGIVLSAMDELECRERHEPLSEKPWRVKKDE